MFEKLRKNGEKKDSAPEDTVQSLRSWIRKIEQSTTSVSSRLAAVEKRLSGGDTIAEAGTPVFMQGPVETFLRNGKKRNTGQLAQILDSELTTLHNEMMKQGEELQSLKTLVTAFEEKQGCLTQDVHSMRAMMTQFDEKIRMRLQGLERREPLVMRLGTMEIPIEFTGIIGGALAFLIAGLVLLNQKAVLLSPVFLSGVGLLLIGSALVKMVRTRSKKSVHYGCSTPVAGSPVQMTLKQCEQKEG
jgi:hypothetical protein